MQMKVFKFGGASVDGIERIRHVGKIIAEYRGEKLVIVISAIGKTTNALEKVAEAFYASKTETALELFNVIKQSHLNFAKYLLVRNYNETLEQLSHFFTEIEWLLHDKPVRDYDYYYDQIVCIGELLSTAIISAYLNETGIANQWLDVRDIFRTDNNFRDANINWEITGRQVTNILLPLLEGKDIVITQGFIGSTDENESTTLGREGSDYTAAVFANLLNADSQTIWKDVEGIMNADPKKFKAAQLISELNYNEIIEMAYYGAQVIHPKTIKPLQNKGIPLFVKSFTNSSLPGTIIHAKHVKGLPPVIVLKEKQVLMQFNARDFSFIGEHAVGELFHLFEQAKIKPNLTQNGAISFLCCLDDHEEKIERIASEASMLFDVEVEKGLTLLTIRHYTEELLRSMLTDKKTVLRQEFHQTVQVLMKG
jgi:aspartate kinase